MRNGVAIGQYYPGESVLHKLDARIKLLFTIAFMVAIFLCHNFFSLGAVAAAGLLFAFLSRVPLRMLLRSLRAILMLVIFTGLLNIFYSQGTSAHILWQLPLPIRDWRLTVTREGVFVALFTTVRIVTLVLVSSLLTFTTTPSMLTTGIEKLLLPLEKLHIPVGIFAMMMTLALRFIPTLVEEADRIIAAQKSRGTNFETGSVLHRAKAFIPVLVPLFVSAFRRAAELAYAMESRCYTGIGPRTSMKELRLHTRDALAAGVLIVLFALVLLANYAFPKVM
jgi:energy-coupling factor transport system permease protein